jgi:hypothetical protein
MIESAFLYYSLTRYRGCCCFFIMRVSEKFWIWFCIFTIFDFSYCRICWGVRARGKLDLEPEQRPLMNADEGIVTVHTEGPTAAYFLI